MTELELRLQCALSAARWLGTREGSAEHRELLEIYNSIRPLPRGYALRESDPWCAAFASATAVLAGAGELLPLECSCAKIIEKAKTMGIWVEEDDYVPQIGDWVLYNWDAAQSGDDTGAPDHVGVVIGRDGERLLAAEGNYDNAVKLRRLCVNDQPIRGFVCPRFSGEEAPESTGIRTIQQVPEYARATVEKLLSDGSLKGVAEGDLGLTEELLRVLVILDRRGVL